MKKKTATKKASKKKKMKKKKMKKSVPTFALSLNVAGLEERIIRSKRAPIDGQTSSGKGTAKNSKNLHA